MANNRICLTCGKAYEYCGSCPSSLNLPVWKNLFDTENCKTVFETVSDYAQKVITKESAKEKLSKCDLSVEFKEKIDGLVKEIIAEEVTEAVVNETIEPVIPKMKYGNKKKFTAKDENED